MLPARGGAGTKQGYPCLETREKLDSKITYTAQLDDGAKQGYPCLGAEERFG